MKTLCYSGGLDSTVLLFELMTEGMVMPIGFNYGQRHHRELAAALDITGKYGLSFKIADISMLRDIMGGSSQTDMGIRVPHGHYTSENMKLTVVPNRNMILLAIATAYAITNGSDTVCYSAHAGDHTIYPDCRPEFIRPLSEAISKCDWAEVKLSAPYATLTKAEIVKRGTELGVPFELTWSCYEGGEIHCGRCGTCVERKEAFALAGVPDPTRYKG